jgi:hypothetical protein
MDSDSDRPKARAVLVGSALPIPFLIRLHGLNDLTTRWPTSSDLVLPDYLRWSIFTVCQWCALSLLEADWLSGFVFTNLTV